MTQRLLRAYRATRCEAGGVCLFVGRYSRAMDELLRMQRALVERLRRFPMLQADGRCRGWREEHVLVLASIARVRPVARIVSFIHEFYAVDFHFLLALPDLAGLASIRAQVSPR